MIRGLMARLMGRVRATEVAFQLMGLQADEHPITIYEQGQPLPTTVARLAAEAIKNIHPNKEAVHE